MFCSLYKKIDTPLAGSEMLRILVEDSGLYSNVIASLDYDIVSVDTDVDTSSGSQISSDGNHLKGLVSCRSFIITDT